MRTVSAIKTSLQVPAIFWIYLGSLVALATLPLNSGSEFTLNHTFVIHVRLDHLLHGTMMLPWMILSTGSARLSASSALVTGLLAAFFLEGIQYFLPWRAFNINDLISNLSGILLGFFFYFIYHHKR